MPSIWLIGAVALVLANIALQLLDVWTTVAALESGGGEQNPFSRAIMETFGINAWVGIKLAIVGVLAAWMAWLMRTATPDAVRRSVLPAGAMALWMSYVIANNLQVLASI